LPVSAIALLSPGESYRDLLTIPAMQQYQDRECLIISAEDDNYSSVSSQKLMAVAGSETQHFQYSSGGHGTLLFESQSDLSQRLIQYMLTHLQKN